MQPNKGKLACHHPNGHRYARPCNLPLDTAEGSRPWQCQCVSHHGKGFCRCSRHRGRVKGRHFEVGGLILEELLELPLGSLGLEFEAHDILRGRRNEPHSALATIPRLGAHGIEEGGEGILLNLLGSWKPLGELS